MPKEVNLTGDQVVALTRKYLAAEDVAFVQKALIYAMECHSGQTRRKSRLGDRAARWKVAEGCFVLVCGGLVEATCRERCIAIIGRTLWRHDCREENQ